MTTFPSRLPLLVLVFTVGLAPDCSGSPQREAEPVNYTLRLLPAEGRVAVEMTLPSRSGVRVFIMPRSIPMGYGTAPYDRFVEDFSALNADGEPLPVERTARIGPRWTVGDKGSTLHRIRYRVNVSAMERSILQASDASKIRARYAGLLGYSVFGFVEGLENSPVTLSVKAPADWPVFTTLLPTARPATGSARATAANFYELADSQVVFGADLTVLKVDGTPPIYLACYAECEVDHALIGSLSRQALDALVSFFGSAPFTRYTVHMEFLKPLTPQHQYGFSMEHLDSTTIFLGTDRALTKASTPRSRSGMLYNLAHHMAHSWIPKRCAMKGYFPTSWEVAPVLDSIWFSEGFGQWAAMDALARVREDGAEWRQRLLDRRFRRTLQLAPRYLRKLPLVEVSRLASTQYSSNFATGLSVFSRGALMAEEIDQAVRTGTHGKKSLREGLVELMRLATSKKEPITVTDLVEAVRRATGVDVTRQVEAGLAPRR